MAIRIAVLLGLSALALYGSVHADYTARADVRDFISTLSADHGFEEAQLMALFGDVQRQQTVLDAISRPAERTLKWHEYRNIFLKEPRISQGLEFWSRNEPALLEAETRYGVAPEYIVAIIGVETRYGRITGGYRVIDALTTLAFDYPPRSDFFRKELVEYLLLSREEEQDPLDLKGSYAGAMGYGQFIPSSYRAYAVDFDEDGQRDIWGSETDAIGSVANYFSRHGWQHSEPVALLVDVSGDRADAVANESLNLKRTVGELEALGVQVPDFAADRKAGLYRMQLEDASEYWLALDNFHVITRYNRSRLYALAVHQLSQAILQQRKDQLTASR